MKRKKSNHYNYNRGQYKSILNDMSKQCKVIKEQIAINKKICSLSKYDIEIYEEILSKIIEIESFVAQGKELLKENDFFKDVEVLNKITTAYKLINEICEHEKRLSIYSISQ